MNTCSWSDSKLSYSLRVLIERMEMKRMIHFERMEEETDSTTYYNGIILQPNAFPSLSEGTLLRSLHIRHDLGQIRCCTSEGFYSFQWKIEIHHQICSL